MPSTYIALAHIPDVESLLIAHAGSQEAIGSAYFLLDVWSPKVGIVGLYDLFVEENEVGAFALLSDARFISYKRLVEEAHLPPEPQHAVMVAMRDSQVHDRELICPVCHPHTNNTCERWYIYHKLAGAETGRYEYQAENLIDALHHYQQIGSHALLLPYRIEQSIAIGSGAH